MFKPVIIAHQYKKVTCNLCWNEIKIKSNGVKAKSEDGELKVKSKDGKAKYEDDKTKVKAKE